MKNASTALSVFWILAAVPVPLAPAQAQAPGPQLFYVTDVQVKPAMGQKYEAGIKREIELGYPEIFYGSRSDDYHYYTVMPVANFGGIDTVVAREEAWMADVGKEKIDALMKGVQGTFESYDTYVYSLEPALSYYPAHPRLRYRDIRFICWAFAYVEWGKEKELEEIFRQWVALYKSKGIGNGWETYVVRLGPSLPLYIWEMGGKSPADFYQSDEEDSKTVGREAVNALWAKMMGCLRKYDFKMGTLLPELSNLSRKR